MIKVEPSKALMDVPLSIELSGFPPNQPVTVAATQIYQTGSRWRAQATFLADDEGHFNIGRQAPISGDYEGVAAMGLIWSAKLVTPPSRALPEDWAMHPSSIQFTATTTQGNNAEVEVIRDKAAAGVIRRVIRTDGLAGTLFLPPGEGPRPAVLVLHGGNGAGPGGSGDETQGAMLASRGYAAFNIAYFAAPGLPRGLVNIPLEYFEGDPLDARSTLAWRWLPGGVGVFPRRRARLAPGRNFSGHKRCQRVGAERRDLLAAWSSGAG